MTSFTAFIWLFSRLGHGGSIFHDLWSAIQNISTRNKQYSYLLPNSIDRILALMGIVIPDVLGIIFGVQLII
jgi:hypothetical protein